MKTKTDNRTAKVTMAEALRQAGGQPKRATKNVVSARTAKAPKPAGKPNALQRAKALAPKLVKAPPTQAELAAQAEDDRKAQEAYYRDAPDLDLATGGRPTCFTPEIGVRLCRLIADGTPMVEIFLIEGMPHKRTFLRWMAKEGPVFDIFRHQVVRAREARATGRDLDIETYITQLTDPNLSTKAGLRRLDPQEAKVAIEGQRILQACEAPKKYGKALTLKGDPAAPLVTRTVRDYTDAELLAMAQGGLEQSDG